MRQGLVLLLILMGFSLCIHDSPQSTPSDVSTDVTQENQILVVHFHRIAQCTCCINVGEWAEETAQELFPREFESGTIRYLNVCVEENPELASKYNAYGASLYINIVKEGRDNITENVEVWQYCFDHDNYVSLLKTVLENALEQL
ncbi:MAG: nitrophenyl compound nitroreductase subunit ArsF family protein [Candidatus Methanofastidiosia archaeon]